MVCGVGERLSKSILRHRPSIYITIRLLASTPDRIAVPRRDRLRNARLKPCIVDVVAAAALAAAASLDANGFILRFSTPGRTSGFFSS